MGSRADVSFYCDLLHKSVVDCDGEPVGAVLDVAAGPAHPPARISTIQRLVIRPHRRRCTAVKPLAGSSLVLAWGEVEAVEACRIRLRQAKADLVAGSLERGQVLLRKHVMDHQLVDRWGHKLQRVNDVAMTYADGTLQVWGVDVGVKSLLTRLTYRWDLLGLFRPLSRRLHRRFISWDLVERVEPARGHIRLRLPSDAIRAAREPSHGED
jgi:sporulation protein YlmC with PRC-barrel domain